MASVASVLNAARNRLLAARVGRSVLVATTISAVVAIATAILLRRFGPFEPAISLAIPIIVVAVTSLRAWLRRPSMHEAARELDESHRLHDAFTTAVSLRAAPRADPAFALLHAAKTETLAARVDLARLRRRAPASSVFAGAGAALIGLAAAIIVPWPEPWVRPESASKASMDAVPPSAVSEQDRREIEETERLSRRITELAQQREFDEAEALLHELERRASELDRRRSNPDVQADAGALAHRQATEDPPAGSRIEPVTEHRSQGEGEPRAGDRALARSASTLGDAAQAVREGESLPVSETPDRTGVGDPPPKQGPDDSGSAPGPAGPEDQAQGQSVDEKRTKEVPGTASESRDSAPAEGAERAISENIRSKDWNNPPFVSEDDRKRGTAGERDRSPSSSDRSVPDQGQLTRVEKGSRQAEGAQGKGNTWTPQPGDHKSTGSTEPKDLQPGSEGKGGQPRPEKGAAEPVFGGQRNPDSTRRSERGDQADSDPSTTPQGGADPGDSARPEMTERREGAPVTGAGPDSASEQTATERRERIAQGLEEIARRYGDAASDRRPDPRAADAPARADGPVDPASGSDGEARHGRGLGTDAGDESGRTGAPPSSGRTASPPRSYDVRAVPENPDAPGSVLHGERQRDPSAPNTTASAASSGSAASGGASRAAGDPSIAPRFRPLIARYFERSGTVRGSGAGRIAPDAAPAP